MPGTALVIFDCDGVLVDSEPLAMRVLLETLGGVGLRMDADEAYAAFLGRSLAAMCALVRERWGVDVDDDALAVMRERLYGRIRHELRAMPGAVDAVRELQVPCCVASSSQLERVALELEVTGLAPLFGANLFCAAMVTRGKPAPDLFLHAASEMRVEPAACVVVEDSPVGITAAVDAGMRALGFTGGSHARSEAHGRRLRERGAGVVFDDLAELPGLVRAL